MDNEYNFKTIIIGDSYVGKTSYLNYLISGKIPSSHKPTVGVEFSIKKIKLDNNQTIKFQLWDTAGQEKFDSINKIYYRGAIAVIIIFDLTNEHSFENLFIWINKVKNNCNENVSLFIVGNKSDLLDKRVIKPEDINNFMQFNNLDYYEISCLSGENVYESLHHIGKILFQKVVKGDINKSLVMSTNNIKTRLSKINDDNSYDDKCINC